MRRSNIKNENMYIATKWLSNVGGRKMWWQCDNDVFFKDGECLVPWDMDCGSEEKEARRRRTESCRYWTNIHKWERNEGEVRASSKNLHHYYISATPNRLEASSPGHLKSKSAFEWSTAFSWHGYWRNSVLLHSYRLWLGQIYISKRFAKRGAFQDFGISFIHKWH